MSLPRDYVYLDLISWRLAQKPQDPGACLLLSRQETCHGDEEPVWLLARPQPDPKEWGLKAISFKDAETFITSILSGRLATGAISHLVHLAKDQKGVDETQRFLLEKTHFARQFNTPYPSQGLHGFLNKKKAKFDLDPKTSEELHRLLEWLRA